MLILHARRRDAHARFERMEHRVVHIDFPEDIPQRLERDPARPQKARHGRGKRNHRALNPDAARAAVQDRLNLPGKVVQHMLRGRRARAAGKVCRRRRKRQPRGLDHALRRRMGPESGPPPSAAPH